MKNSQRMVEEFHKAFDIQINTKPTIPSTETIKRRSNLMHEELHELMIGMVRGDLVSIADGLADLLYVVLGTAVECGIDIEPIFNEVHRSNMTKVNGHKREDGKWIKPDTYSKADIGSLIRKQLGE